MKKPSVKKLAVILLSAFLFLSIQGCDSTVTPGYQVFENTKKADPVVGMIKGSVNYGVGFYLPSEQSTMDISLVMINSRGDEVLELAHQRIRNVQRFPFQYSLHFDENELIENMQYKIVVRFTNDGKNYLATQSQSVSLYPPDNMVLTLN